MHGDTHTHIQFRKHMKLHHSVANVRVQLRLPTCEYGKSSPWWLLLRFIGYMKMQHSYELYARCTYWQIGIPNSLTIEYRIDIACSASKKRKNVLKKTQWLERAVQQFYYWNYFLPEWRCPCVCECASVNVSLSCMHFIVVFVRCNVLSVPLDVLFS